MSKQDFKPEEPNDLGFGTQVTNPKQRLLNRNGKANVLKKGLPAFRAYDIYLRLITMGWPGFLILTFFFYLTANLVFASIYVTIGKGALMGASTRDFLSEFEDAFFFSSQTISTLGFARISPSGLAASSVAAIESLIGLLGFALITGVLFGRFSRPEAKILYSDLALIAPYREITGLMFRIANMRRSELIDVDISVNLSRNELHGEKYIRKFYPLKLERKIVPLLSMSWTIVHPIEEESPLFGKTIEEMVSSDVEVMVLLRAFDDTFAQTVHSRISYKATEMIMGARFVPIIHQNEAGMMEVDLDKIGEYHLIDRSGQSELNVNSSQKG